LEDAAQWAAPSGASALLFNFSKPEVMHSGTNLQIGVYGNAFEGEQDEPAANEIPHATEEDLNDDAYSWADAAVTMVGARGIGADDIHRLKKALLSSQEE
jgi:S-methylmethionine-dependent homocysteine/selenocysteine methylase